MKRKQRTKNELLYELAKKKAKERKKESSLKGRMETINQIQQRVKEAKERRNDNVTD